MPVLLLFALTLFVSAALLFTVELMIGKALLPMLGGTPAVWNTCMVFYQALLLAGYGYAHAATSLFGVRRTALLHLGILLLPLLTLGITLHRSLFDYGTGSPIPGLLLGLLLSVGLPFFVISTSAPLLQKWFAETGHSGARDPYFLYAASNLGSMVGLFGYPFVLEPWLTLAQQRLFWQVGYGVLALLTAACILCVWRSPDTSQKIATPPKDAEPPAAASDGTVSSWRRFRWVALAFVPSSLMLGVTTYMTTDIAAIPLLWVLPLGLYLLSFILVFSRLPDVFHQVMVVLLPLVVLGLVFVMLSEWPLWMGWKIVLHLVVLFVAAMVCHGELARDRPPPRYLTGYYLWMSFGGVLGGLFNGLAAPVIFNGLVEYPLALVIACLLTPSLEEEKPTRVGSILGTGLMGFFLGGGVALLVVALGRTDLDLKGLSGTDGLWLATALAAVLILPWVALRADDEDRAARWLDLGLPVALGVLAVGLHLSLYFPPAQRGLYWLFGLFLESIANWMPQRFLAVFNLLNLRTFRLLCIFGPPVVLCYLFVKRPLRFGLGVGALLLAGSFCELLDEDLLLRERSFFGVLHVSDRGNYRRLEHGTTLHGQQRYRWDHAELASGAASFLAAPDPLSAVILSSAGHDTWRNPGREPLTYFHRTGPIGQIFEAYRDHLKRRHVAIIGLGSGTLASYGQSGQQMTFYEIDPLVRRIAEDRTYFTYVQDAIDRGVKIDIVLGDARLKLEERADQKDRERFALLVVDAFSSDAIPIHLLTRQALNIYLENLADDGILVFHISNRYLNLEPVLANLVAELKKEKPIAGLIGFIQADFEGGIPGKASSNWVVLARQAGALDRLVHEERYAQWQAERSWGQVQEMMLQLAMLPDSGGRTQLQGALEYELFASLRPPWRRLKERPEVGIWSDDYSNLLRVFDWKN